MGRNITIELLGLPPRTLSPNFRGHWAVKARAVNAYRTYVYLMANQARPRDWEVLEKATISLTFIAVDRRRRDLDNLLSSFKAGIDGLIDAGILRDDSAEHLAYGSIKLIQGEEGEPKTIVTIGEQLVGTTHTTRSIS